MPTRNVPDDWHEISMELGRRVRTTRKEHGLTQEDLAHKAGVSRNQIQNIENSRNNARDESGKHTPGPGNPTLDTMWAIANALDVDVEYLVARRHRT